MLFLSNNEREVWEHYGKKILSNGLIPKDCNFDIRLAMKPIFCYYAGTLLSAHRQVEKGKEWLKVGAMEEEEGVMSNSFLLGFLDRQKGQFIIPDVAFADPRPYVHFTTVPVIKESRRKLLKHCVQSLPEFKKPFRFMDIGCGDGSLTALFLKKLREAQIINDIEEIFLVDSSKGMIELAKETVGKDFNPSIIKTANYRIEEISQRINTHYDLVLSSLAYHHMPFDKKLYHLTHLKPWIDNFMIFELDANNESPEVYSPELALSIYQSYGRMVDFVFSHDASVEIAVACVDRFLMTELVSFFTQARNIRTDYHMLRTQWHDLFNKAFGKEFTCLCDSICTGDEYYNLFLMHYGR